MLLVSLLALVATAPAPAKGAAATSAVPDLAIVDVESPDMLMGLAGQVTRSLVAAAAAQKLTTIGPDELRKSLDERQYETLRKCGDKPACVAQVLEGHAVNRVVLGQFSRDEKNYLVRLWLIDVKNLKVVADVDRAVLIAARRLQKDLDEAVPRLLRGEREARGTLVIESNLADAQISVNGEFVGTPPQSIVRRPGKYEIKLERRKYLSVTRLVNVEAEREVHERIVLLLKPGEIPDDQEMPALVKKPASPAAPASTPGLVLSPGTWISIVATAAAGGTSLYFGLTARSQEKALLDGYDATTHVYQGTRAQALSAQQNALVANVLFGVTGAAFVSAVIFFIHDVVSQPVSQPAVTVAPAFDPARGAGLVLEGHF